jgi:hypothetical protein
MISVILSALVIAFSLALFLYWFRYSCILILRTRTTADFSSSLASGSDLTFDQIQRELESGSTGVDLETFRRCLEHDYELISSLLSRAPAITEHFSQLEQMMLQADYKVMQAWDTASRRLFRQPSRRAIAEMSAIVAFFANVAGEAGVLASEA